jgi:hypothetical protein
MIPPMLVIFFSFMVIKIENICHSIYLFNRHSWCSH